MKFGIFYELQLPRPWTERSEYQLLQDALAQIELADRLGFDYAWAVEHHFLEEYSHCSAPEVFLGAASQRTRRIRLGHGIIQLPTNHPLRVAERVATLDLLTGGRVELGLGEGQGPVELHPFGARVREKRDVWEEAVRALVPAFTKTTWEWHGRFFDFPARNVLPKPYQKPHPPLWVACSNIATIANAGRWGMGALGFQFVSSDAARAWVNRYYLELTQHQAKLADYPTNPNIAMVTGFMCAETDEEAFEKAAGWTFFVFCLSHYGKNGIPNPGEGNMWEAYQAWRKTEQAEATLRSGLIGSSDTIRRRLREFEATGVDQVILLNQAGRTSHEDICRSLEMFARDVMPEFHAREPQHVAWKADVLAGRVEISDEGADTYKVYAHQNEDIVRLTPEELKAKMAAKERASGSVS
ncbi:MAG: LLM class flavin-dependent oxidoreductase [Candidatus Rokubacteria bacterium]|nr:LLM class flavin-dependent oxidoreductase [Candidatus Rokubacteria bacterium]